MPLRDDQRAVSVWIGFLFLVLFLVLALTVYQASVVPDQIARAEADHAEAVTDDMRTVLARISLLGARGGTLSVPVDLAPEYPASVLAIHPAPPSGAVRTTTAGNVTISVDGTAVDLSRTCGYGGDASVPTRSLAYTVDYNRYAAGTLVYGHSVLYRESNGSHVLLSDQQSIVSGETITLAPLATGYSVAGGDTETVRLVGGPVDRRTLDAGANEPVRISLPSDLPAEKWATLLETQTNVREVVQVTDSRVAIVLEPGHTYTLACYGVGLGQAPPSGVRPVGGEALSGDTEGTETPTESPSGDHAPDVTIRNVTIHREKVGGNTETRVDVAWNVSDVDADLLRVTLRVTNTDSLNTESRSFRVRGSSARATFVFEFPGAKKSDPFRIDVYAVDRHRNWGHARVTK